MNPFYGFFPYTPYMLGVSSNRGTLDISQILYARKRTRRAKSPRRYRHCR